MLILKDNAKNAVREIRKTCFELLDHLQADVALKRDEDNHIILRDWFISHEDQSSTIQYLLRAGIFIADILIYDHFNSVITDAGSVTLKKNINSGWNYALSFVRTSTNMETAPYKNHISEIFKKCIHIFNQETLSYISYPLTDESANRMKLIDQVKNTLTQVPYQSPDSLIEYLFGNGSTKTAITWVSNSIKFDLNNLNEHLFSYLDSLNQTINWYEYTKTHHSFSENLEKIEPVDIYSNGDYYSDYFFLFSNKENLDLSQKESLKQEFENNLSKIKENSHTEILHPKLDNLRKEYEDSINLKLSKLLGELENIISGCHLYAKNHPSSIHDTEEYNKFIENLEKYKLVLNTLSNDEFTSVFNSTTRDKKLIDLDDDLKIKYMKIRHSYQEYLHTKEWEDLWNILHSSHTCLFNFETLILSSITRTINYKIVQELESIIIQNFRCYEANSSSNIWQQLDQAQSFFSEIFYFPDKIKVFFEYDSQYSDLKSAINVIRSIEKIFSEIENSKEKIDCKKIDQYESLMKKSMKSQNQRHMIEIILTTLGIKFSDSDTSATLHLKPLHLLHAKINAVNETYKLTLVSDQTSNGDDKSSLPEQLFAQSPDSNQHQNITSLIWDTKFDPSIEFDAEKIITKIGNSSVTVLSETELIAELQYSPPLMVHVENIVLDESEKFGDHEIDGFVPSVDQCKTHQPSIMPAAKIKPASIQQHSASVTETAPVESNTMANASESVAELEHAAVILPDDNDWDESEKFGDHEIDGFVPSVDQGKTPQPSIIVADKIEPEGIQQHSASLTETTPVGSNAIANASESVAELEHAAVILPDDNDWDESEKFGDHEIDGFVPSANQQHLETEINQIDDENSLQSLPPAPTPTFPDRHLGKIAATTISLGLSGMTGGFFAGLFLLPFTFGLSLPVCALMGLIGGAVVGLVSGIIAGAITDKISPPQVTKTEQGKNKPYDGAGAVISSTAAITNGLASSSPNTSLNSSATTSSSPQSSGAATPTTPPASPKSPVTKLPLFPRRFSLPLLLSLNDARHKISSESSLQSRERAKSFCGRR